MAWREQKRRAAGKRQHDGGKRHLVGGNAGARQTPDERTQEALEAARGLLKALRTEIRAGKPVDMDRRRRDLAERIAALQ